MGKWIHRKPEPATVRGVCVKCGKNPQRPYGVGKYRSLCRQCYDPRKGGRNKAKISARLAFIQKWKRTHPCVDCDEDDPVVLEFDHRDPKEKLFQISDGGGSMSALIAEIAKCDMRCCNCHRRRSASEGHGVYAPQTKKAPAVS